MNDFNLKKGISVCIATYNGSKFILEQLMSVIQQLSDEDEIIIVDDGSTDNTIQIIKNINDNRINLVLNERNMGHVFSFSRAISLSHNDVVFLCDQDDIWIARRKELMLNRLVNSGKALITSNYNILYNDGVTVFKTKSLLLEKKSYSHFANILGIFLGTRSYYGCAMAFKKELKNIILPMPSFIESHDLWIAMAANLKGSNLHMEEVSLTRRLHGGNVTNPDRKLAAKIRSRIIYFLSIFILLIRIIKADTSLSRLK